MSENRVRRVEGQMKKDISQVIFSELKDPRLSCLTSVTDVELSRDLHYAQVYVSVLGTAEEKEEILQVLRQARGLIRCEIGKRIRLKHTPEINFFLDNSIEYGARIESLLKTLKEEESKGNE